MPSRSSFLGLPLELRNNIYEFLFFDPEIDKKAESFIMFTEMCREVYSPVPNRGLLDGPSAWREPSAIICTNRQIRDEAYEYKYSNLTVYVEITPWKEIDMHGHKGRVPVGKAGKMYLWRFVKHLQLEVPFEAESFGETDHQMASLAVFSQQSLKNGKYLNTLVVWFMLFGTSAGPKCVSGPSPFPEWYPEAVETLKQMRARGEVTVTTANPKFEDDKLCPELEDIIRGVKDMKDAVE